MNLAIFDLDNTLIGGDSDYLWGEFLVEKNWVDAELYARENQRFYDEYKVGTLDIYEFLEFSLAPLKDHTVSELQAMHHLFMQEKIQSIWLAKAENLLATHKANNDFLLIITATNHFVTGPIAEKLGVDAIIATMPEQINQRYTGKVDGEPCFQEGKVKRLSAWLKKHPYTLDNSYFYSDSINDLPLLKKVSHPIVVDADEKLQAYAKQHQWKSISLR